MPLRALACVLAIVCAPCQCIQAAQAPHPQPAHRQGSRVSPAVQGLVDSGFSHFYNLEYDAAIANFEEAAHQQPGDPEFHNYVAQGILFREMYRVGALESELVTGNNSFLRRPKLNPDPQTDARFNSEIKTSIEICEKRLSRDSGDLDALYAAGIAYGLRANYNFLVHKAWRDALRDATTGRKYHNRITQIDPSQVDARLVQGLHDYLVGSLPLMYRMLGFVVGFRGDKEQGIKTIELVAAKGSRNRVDAEIFLCALYRREGQPRKAVPLLHDLIGRFPRNYLLRFELGQMYSALGEKQNALRAIEEVADAKRRGLPGYGDVSWEKIYFQLGTVQFWHNDLQPALDNMKKVAEKASEVDLNTGVLAWLRIGQIYDLTNRRTLAVEAYKEAIRYAPQAEAAATAKRYLSAPYRRERT
jgi:tetratricopeptide (TPR) repeat protein